MVEASLFRLGGQVVWNEKFDRATAKRHHAMSMAARYGRGPFKVVGLYLSEADTVTVTVEFKDGTRQAFDGRYFKPARR